MSGLDDPRRLIAIIGTTAKLEFRLVDLTVPPQQVLQTPVPADSAIIYEGKGELKRPVLVYKQVMVEGADLTDAKVGYDQSGQPVVEFTFNGSGARKFGDVTKENVGRPFAIVLDNEVISRRTSASRSQAAGELGQFTVETANNLAIRCAPARGQAHADRAARRRARPRPGLIARANTPRRSAVWSSCSCW